MRKSRGLILHSANQTIIVDQTSDIIKKQAGFGISETGLLLY